jgi:hypothetical protein
MAAYARTIGLPAGTRKQRREGKRGTRVQSLSDALYPVHHCVREHVQIRANEEILP